MAAQPHDTPPEVAGRSPDRPQPAAERVIQLRLRWEWLLPLLLVAVTLLAYANSFGREFVWDDQALAGQNRLLQDPGQWFRLFGRDMWAFAQGRGMGHDLYRPLVSLTYLLDVRLWGERVPLYHVANLLFHLASTLLVYALGLQLLGGAGRETGPSASGRLAAGLAALLFGLHPVHSEAVAWINGRTDLMSTCFFLLSFWLYLLYRRRERLGTLLGALLAFLLALLAKEMAITLPAVVGIYVLCFDDAPWRAGERDGKRLGWGQTRPVRAVVEALPFVAVAVLYLTVRLVVLGSVLPGAGGEDKAPGGVLLAAQVLALYLRLLVVPYSTRLGALRPVSALQAVQGAAAWLAPAVVVGVLVAGLAALRRWRLLGFAVLFFFVTALPVSWLLPVGEYVAERFLYLPSVAICLALGALLAWVWSRQRMVALALILVIVLPWGVLTAGRNAVWHDRLTFWSRAVQDWPDDATAHSHLGLEYLNRGQPAQALAEFRRALEADPESDAAYNGLGTVYVAQGQLPEAEAAFQKAAELAPDVALPRYNLGVVFEAQGKPEEAVAAYQKAVELDPAAASARLNLGFVLIRLERWDEAWEQFEAVLHSEPEGVAQVPAHRGLGQILFRQGRPDEAIAAYQEALRLDPQSVEAMNDLGLVYLNVGETEQATAQFEQALGLEPRYLPAHLNLALAYQEAGLTEQALRELAAVLELDPNNLDAAALMEEWQAP